MLYKYKKAELVFLVFLSCCLKHNSWALRGRWKTSPQCESYLSWGDEHLGDQPQRALKFTFQRALPTSDEVSKAGDVYWDLEGRSCSLTQFQEAGVFWQCSNDILSQCVTLNYDTTPVCAKKVGFDLIIRPGLNHFRILSGMKEGIVSDHI